MTSKIPAQRHRNPWVTALALLTLAAVVVGLGLMGANSAIGRLTGEAMLGAGLLALVVLLAVGAINWQVRHVASRRGVERESGKAEK